MDIQRNQIPSYNRDQSDFLCAHRSFEKCK
jgi:hypothetical protein